MSTTSKTLTFVLFAVLLLFSFSLLAVKLSEYARLNHERNFLKKSSLLVKRLEDYRKQWSPKRNDSNNDRIFFHETSGRNSLTIRQTCAVESAAKNNPHRPIQLFLQADQFNESSPSAEILQRYSNVKVFLLNVDDYFNGTILHDWYKKGQWRNSPYRLEHFSDYIRMLSLERGGGMYLDLDIITLKAFDSNMTRNFVSMEDDRSLTGSALHLDQGHQLISHIMIELATDYQPKNWGFHGPALIKRVMTEVCDFVPGQSMDHNRCHDVHVLPHQIFYPINFNRWSLYFQSVNKENLALIKDSSAVHVWNKLSHDYTIDWKSDQLYSTLAGLHCPLTVSRADDFVGH